MTTLEYRELVQYATLAASSHNTQPWMFDRDADSISIVPDFSRRCPAVDPDDHHLFVSVGCALENLTIAAAARGLLAQPSFDAVRGAIIIGFEDTSPHQSSLFSVMSQRQCSRADYNGESVSGADLKRLEDAGGGNGCGILLLTNKAQIETVAEFVARGNDAQFGNRKFIDELTAWIRFNRVEARRTGDGLSARVSGNPEVPRWMGRLIMRSAFAARTQREKDIRQIRSSAGIAVFVSEKDDPAHWIDVGRRYERFALHATELAVRNAFINQPIEAADIRPQFAGWLGLGTLRPDLIVRFGHGPEMPRSFRRPIDQVLH